MFLIYQLSFPTPKEFRTILAVNSPMAIRRNIRKYSARVFLAILLLFSEICPDC